MSLQTKRKIEELFLKLAFVTGAIVLLFSILGGYPYFIIVLRTLLSFLVIVFLGKVFGNIWGKVSPPPPKKVDKFQSTIDFLLGDEIVDSLNKQKEENHEASLAGQINADMKNGLQDAGTKAEIVRRMGWGEEKEVQDV